MFLPVPDYPGCPGPKLKAVKRLCVRVISLLYRNTFSQTLQTSHTKYTAIVPRCQNYIIPKVKVTFFVNI